MDRRTFLLTPIAAALPNIELEDPRDGERYEWIMEMIRLEQEYIAAELASVAVQEYIRSIICGRSF